MTPKQKINLFIQAFLFSVPFVAMFIICGFLCLYLVS